MGGHLLSAILHTSLQPVIIFTYPVAPRHKGPYENPYPPVTDRPFLFLKRHHYAGTKQVAFLL